jgi:hypothetical protein
MLLRAAMTVCVLALTACTDDTSLADSGGETGCDITIRETFPAADSINAYYLSPIEFHLSKPHEEDATLTVEGLDGTVEWNDDRTTIFFNHDGLAPSTSYSATLSYCYADATVNFTTSDLGTELAVDITGRTYSLDLSSGRIVVPEGVGAALAPYLEFEILAAVNEIVDNNLLMNGAIGDDENPGTQDYCSPTIEFPSADFTSSPYFQLGPQTTTIAIAGYSVTIDDLLISGTFASDGSYFGGGILSGLIDTRPLVELVFDDEDDPNAICDFILGFGVSCVSCPSGEGDFCLEIKAVDLLAEEAETPIEEIEFEDCHLQCSDTWDKTGANTNPECTLVQPPDTSTCTDTTC